MKKIDINKAYSDFLEDSTGAPDSLRTALTELENAFDLYIGEVTRFEWYCGFETAVKILKGGES